jgi:hypothetical protein
MVAGCFVEAGSAGVSVDSEAFDATVTAPEAGIELIEPPSEVPAEASVELQELTARDAALQDSTLGLPDAGNDGSAPDAALVAAPDGAIGVAPDAAAMLDATPGAPDAAVTDASVSDSGALDSGVSDTGIADSGLADSGDSSSVDSGPAECSLAGTYSAEVVLDVKWRAETIFGLIPVIAAGSGQIRFLLRMDSDASGDLAHAKLRSCRGELPDFAGSFLTDELYSAHIPDAAWEAPAMPSWDLNWNVACRKPGCSVNLDSVVVTLGATPGTAWPGRTGSLSTVVSADHDGDGFPGVSYTMRGPPEKNAAGKAYSHPPVTFSLSTRATELQLAFQLRAQVQGKLTSCDAITAGFTQAAVEARAIGCRTRKNATAPVLACDADQIAFVDDNLPNWTVTGGSMRIKRVAASASCAAIRAAWP